MKKLFYIFTALFLMACGMTVNAVRTPYPTPTAHIATGTSTNFVEVSGYPTPTAHIAAIHTVPTHASGIAPTRRATVTAEILRIRSAPSMEADEVGVLAMGDVVIIGPAINTDVPDCSEWYPLQTPNGWVCGKFLEVLK
jgi:hypothetical protein